MKITLYINVKLARFIDDIITFTQRFRLRNYIYALRINKLSGELRNKDANPQLVIFIVFEINKLPNLTLEALKSFKDNGLRLLVVNNGNPIHEEQLLMAGADLVMTRNNTGKDFGGYKDATLYLKNNNLLDWKKIIYANDSVIYPKRIINQLISELVDEKYDFIAHSAVKEIHYHFQSFLFSCGNSLINNSDFIKFWESYLPIDRRRYMIKKGEVGLSKKIFKTGCRINVINTYKEVKKVLTDFDSINDMLNELPDRYRSQKEISEIQSNLAQNVIEAITLKKSRISNDELKDININSAITRYQAVNSIHRNIVENLFREIGIGNPSHLGLSFFLRTNQPFVIKRDLAYRGGYEYDFLSYLLEKYYSEEYKNIIQMIKYPYGNHYKGLKLVMFNNGII